MAKTVNVNFRMDEDVKKTMEGICHELGMSLSTAFIIFAKKVNQEHGIPFKVSLDPFYSESNQKWLKKSIQELEDGKVIIKTMDELEAMAK